MSETDYLQADSISEAKRLSVQSDQIVQAPGGDLYRHGVRIKHKEQKSVLDILPPWGIITAAVLDYQEACDPIAVAIQLASGANVSYTDIEKAIKGCWHSIDGLGVVGLGLDPYEEICKPYAFGAQKYSPRGWEVADIPETECGQAARRHLSQSYTEDRDQESGALHLACAIFHFAAVLFYRSKK